MPNSISLFSISFFVTGMHLRQMSFAPVVAGSFEINDAEEQLQRQPQTVRQPSGVPANAPRERWTA